MPRVRARARLGTLASPNARGFADECAEVGAVGELLPLEDTPPLPQGWRLIRFELDGLVRYAPAHPYHYEDA